MVRACHSSAASRCQCSEISKSPDNAGEWKKNEFVIYLLPHIHNVAHMDCERPGNGRYAAAAAAG